MEKATVTNIVKNVLIKLEALYTLYIALAPPLCRDLL